MIKRSMMVTAAFLALTGMQAAPSDSASPLSLWRLDCGTLDIDDLGVFSDTGLYAGETKTLVASCYLVQDGDRLLLWDTGVDGALAGKRKDAEGAFLREKIVTQLGRIGFDAADITYVGISHYHYDHTGQVADFPEATLLTGKGDWDVIKVWPPAAARLPPTAWPAYAARCSPVRVARLATRSAGGPWKTMRPPS